MQIIEKKTEFYTLRLNLGLSYQVWKTKTKDEKKDLTNVDLNDHPLKGRKLLDHHSQEEYNIQSVHKHWYGGWYIALLIERNGSHGLVIYENISCFHPMILGFIEEAKYRYQVLPSEKEVFA